MEGFSVPYRENLKVNEPGIQVCSHTIRAKRVYTDMLNSSESQAVISPSRITEDSEKTPLKMWKEGKAEVVWRWITQCGTSETRVTFEAPLQVEAEEDEIDTEVLILNLYQPWTPAATWKMWTREGAAAAVEPQ